MTACEKPWGGRDAFGPSSISISMTWNAMCNRYQPPLWDDRFGDLEKPKEEYKSST
jgi:hypothetical protein